MHWFNQMVSFAPLGAFMVLSCGPEMEEQSSTLSQTLEETPAEPGVVDAGAEPPLEACDVRARASIDDLEDGDVDGPHGIGFWFLFNDETGIQRPSNADDLVVRGGVHGSRFMVHSRGRGFTEWGAGFGYAFACAQNAQRFHGVRFKVRAKGKRSFSVQVPTLALLGTEFGGQCEDNCQDFYRHDIALASSKWYECSVRFSDFAQAGWGTQAPFDRKQLTGVQFNIDVEQAPYDLSIDDLAFARAPRTGCVRVGHQHATGHHH